MLNNLLRVMWPEGAAADDGKIVKKPDEPNIPESLMRFGRMIQVLFDTVREWEYLLGDC